MTASEDAVRRYLIFLENPASLVDPDEVEQAEQQVMESNDPIERVRAHAALQKARAGDDTEVRESFILHARAWANSEGLPYSVFAHVNVPTDVLEEAGLLDNKSRRKSTGRGRTPRRAQKVPVTDLTRWMLSQQRPFTTADVANSIGGSPATIKKALDDLTSKNKLENLGVVADHQSRGRAPNLYAVVKESESTPSATQTKKGSKPAVEVDSTSESKTQRSRSRAVTNSEGQELISV